MYSPQPSRDQFEPLCVRDDFVRQRARIHFERAGYQSNARFQSLTAANFALLALRHFYLASAQHSIDLFMAWPLLWKLINLYQSAVENNHDYSGL